MSPNDGVNRASYCQPGIEQIIAFVSSNLSLQDVVHWMDR